MTARRRNHDPRVILFDSFDVFAVLVVRAGARADPPCRPPCSGCAADARRAQSPPLRAPPRASRGSAARRRRRALRPPPSLIAVHPPVRLRVVARADGSTVFVLSPTSSSSSAPAPAGKGDERDDRLGSTDAAAHRDDDEAGEDGFDTTARPGDRRNA